ncbi:MAG: hypothetical protein GY749_34910 [Desulfobacteraceae bacterium]|nr:hypothetical protein [Desulfobacteraceae bacterium]
MGIIPREPDPSDKLQNSDFTRNRKLPFPKLIVFVLSIAAGGKSRGTEAFTDNDGIWGFEQPSDRYLNGTGLMNGTFTENFNDGVGFPSYMAATFQNNDASTDQRPSSFCSQTRSSSDWYTANNPNSPYNQEWFSYMTAMQNYLNSLGYLDKSYYYFANEPQDQADYDAVAWYSQELKKVAPNLKLAVSEEPKPEIYNHSTYTGSKIDIWTAHLGLQFNPDISFDRLTNHNDSQSTNNAKLILGYSIQHHTCGYTESESESEFCPGFFLCNFHLERCRICSVLAVDRHFRSRKQQSVL